MYCDENKKQHAFTAVCPHLGCIVHVGRCLASWQLTLALPPPPALLPPCSALPVRLPCLPLDCTAFLFPPPAVAPQWNSLEKTFDCPCHGSHFDCNGKVINGELSRGLGG